MITDQELVMRCESLLQNTIHNAKNIYIYYIYIHIHSCMTGKPPENGPKPVYVLQAQNANFNNANLPKKFNIKC